MDWSYILEHRMVFLAEARSKTYRWYVAQVLEAKIPLCAKGDLQEQACIALERRGM